jgi:hypothetical protein
LLGLTTGACPILRQLGNKGPDAIPRPVGKLFGIVALRKWRIVRTESAWFIETGGG